MIDFMALAGSIQTLAGLASKIVSTRDTVKFNTYITEFQQALIQANANALSAQTSHASLLARNHKLEEEVVKLKDWATQKQNYALKEVAIGVFAYVSKEPVQGSEPSHWLCCHCFQEGRPSILQLERHSRSGKFYVCHAGNHPININIPQEPIRYPPVGGYT